MRDSSDALHRALKVQYVGSSGIPIPPGHYRVHVEAGDLICDQVDGGATSVEPYDYYFTVALDCDGSGAPGEGDFCTGSTCSGDCDLNGVNDSCDLYFDASFRDRNNNGILDSCEITTACRCDFNGDGYLNSTDFFDFINCFFGSCSGGRTADFNGDGYVNSQDFFDWLDCFFSGC
jgi:hypothetical protein